MDNNRRVPINVSVNPSDYSGRSIRLGNSSNSDIKDKMNQRMREFEEESRKWRDQFLSTPGLSTHHSTFDNNRPRMFFNFPEFPEFGTPLSINSRLGNPSSTVFGFSSPSPFVQNNHKSFIEEDDNGNKKYKMTFEVGDFKPNEIQVRTEGRQLIVKGDRELVAGTASESKQFNREITLPDFVEPTSVTSFLSEGILTVEAPVILERLGYSNQNSIQNSSTSTSSIRNSPFRENSSPSKVNHVLNQTAPSSTSSSARNYRNSREDLLSSSAAGLSSSQNSFNNSHFSNDVQSNPQLASYKFNMSEFRPEDIAITVTDTTLKIHALREENDIRGNGKTYREFKREIGLPHGADVKRLKNALQSDGTLTIEIPVQDNSNLRPPLSPTGINKQFSNFTLNDNLANTNSLLASSSNNGGLVDQTNNGKELKLTFDLTGYKPEDLNIKVIDNNVLKVHAVHIDNTQGNQIHREYTRQYILPEWVQPELLRARMSDDGTLTVEIPLPQVQPNKLERVINIQNSNH